MTTSEKPVPKITGDDDLRLTEVDDPGTGASSLEPESMPAVGQATEAPAWEPKSLEEKMSISRLTFAQKLIGWCVGLIVVMALVQHFSPRPDSVLGAALDTLKLIVTTALGFVFGRAASRS